MSNNSLDRLILGHNQFFGINHLSLERGIAREQYFSNTNNIIDLIRYAHQNGAGGLMLSTHERAKEVATELRKDKNLSDSLHIYVLLPYMVKYVRLANEVGLFGMVTDILGQASLTERIGIVAKAGMGMIKRDTLSKLKSLIDIELLPFKGLNIKAILLHNSLTDLVVGLRILEIVKFFTEYIEDKYITRPGFCTLSAGLLMRWFHENNIDNQIIMAPFNPIGFQMNPSRQVCEQLLRESSSQIIAMSPLAAGCVRPDTAASYISGLSNIRSMVVGASTRVHVDETFKAFISALR